MGLKLNLFIDLLMAVSLVLTFLYASNRQIHFFSAVSFGVLVAIHLIQHWKFIMNTPKMLKN